MSLRVFGKSAILYSFGSVSARVTTFLLIPIQTYFLSINDFGLLSTLLVTSRLLGIFMEFAVQEGLMRFSAEYEKSGKENVLLGTLTILNLCGIIIITIFTLIFLNPFLAITLDTQISGFMVLFVCIIAATQQALTTYPAYFRIKNDIKWFTLSNLFSAVLLVVSSLILLGVYKKGVLGALFSYFIAYFTTTVMVLYRLIKMIGFRFDKKIFKFFIKFNFPLIFGKSGDAFFSTTSMYILGYFTSLNLVAIYSLASKLINIIYSIVTLPFQTAYEPYVYTNLDDKFLGNNIGKIFSYFLLSVTIVSLFLVYLAKDGIVLLSKKEYSAALLPFIIMLPSIMLIGLKTIANSLLLIGKKTKILGYLPFYLSIIFILINYYLTSLFHMYGVILTNYLASMSIIAILIHFGLKEFSVHFEINKILKILSLFLINTISIYLLRDQTNLFYYILLPVILIIFNFEFIFHFIFSPKEKVFLTSWIMKTKMKLIQYFNKH